MNNQEVKQILNRIDQPKNRFLQYVAHWTNSTMGMLSEIIALVIIVSTVIYYDNMQEVVLNLILLIAGSYILFYEIFDFATLEYAVTKDQDVLMGTIIYSLIAVIGFAFFVIFLNDGTKTSLFDNLFLLILMYIMLIIVYGIMSPKLFQIKFLYITNKCKHNKLFELISPYLIRK